MTIETTIAFSCFNAEDTIKRSLMSVLSQKLENTEILVIDDCSKDNSVAVVEALIEEGHLIRLIKNNPNQGFAQVCNILMENAKGTFIAYMDDDDECLPNRIELQKARLLEAEKEFGTKDILCFGNRRCIKPDGTETDVKAIGRKPQIPHGEMVADFMLFKERKEGYSLDRTGTCTMFARVETLKKFGFDPAFRRCAELDLEVRMALEGGYFVGVDDYIIMQHITSGEANEKNYKAERKYYGMLVEKYKGYLKTKNRYLYAKCRIAKMVAWNNQRKIDYYKYLLLCILTSPGFMIERLKAKLLH